jgi:hypothetical protein
VTAEPQVTLGTYLARTTTPAEIERRVDEMIVADYKTRAELDCAKDRALAIRGYVVYANITVEGLKHRSVELYTTVYSDATKRRLANYEHEQAMPPLKLTSPTDTFVQAAFLEVPLNPRSRYFARFEVRTHESGGGLGTLLTASRSRASRATTPARIRTATASCEHRVVRERDLRHAVVALEVADDVEA